MKIIPHRAKWRAPWWTWSYDQLVSSPVQNYLQYMMIFYVQALSACTLYIGTHTLTFRIVSTFLSMKTIQLFTFSTI